MSTIAGDDGSEDVADFLERIKELGDKSQRDDEERTRKLEEEILQGRKERQARRAERARSISPTKDSPLASARSLSNNSTAADNKIPNPSATQRSGREHGLSSGKEASSPLFEPSKPNPPQNLSLSRSDTLSWQQRPSSRNSGLRSRPLSQFASQNAARSPEPTPEPTTEDQELSLSQKAQALQSKDPSWFRQTPDRGLGSAAYRKNQDSSDSFSGNIRLPGLSRESSIDPETMSSSERNSPRPEPSSQIASARATTTTKEPEARSLTSGPRQPARSPFPMTASQTFAPPSSATPSSDADDKRVGRAPVMSQAQKRISDESYAMSPAQSRISPERSPSPTKGVGGFVQSAMMKRSDSVNRRVNQQGAPGLSRGNSTASNRGAPTPLSKPSGLREDRSRDPQSTAERATSRPSSSHSTEITPTGSPTKDGEFKVPALPARGSVQRSNSTASNASADERADYAKTLESRRHTPKQGQSWMDAALSRQDSPPKQKPAAGAKKPEWMENIAKAKHARAQSIDINKGATHKEVVIGGLMRSPAKGSPSPTRLGHGHSSSITSIHKDVAATGSSQKSISSEADRDVPEPTKSSPIASKPGSTTSISKDLTDILTSGTSDLKEEAPKVIKTVEKPLIKPKPETPPKKDFRSSLKPRSDSDAKAKDDVPEFKKAFGTLRRTETKNYVAPDELKDNILRGKSGLNITGGPKKTVIKDEFKDSIIKKMAEFEPGRSNLVTGNFLNKSHTEKEKPAVPEALAKRQLMSTASSTPSWKSPAKSSSVSRDTKSPEPSDTQSSPKIATPEKSSTPGRLQSPSSKLSSSLADRFNSSLAGIIGRGPSPNTAGSDASQQSPPKVLGETPTEPGPELVHTTKGRARGPKRRAPKSATASDEVPEPTIVPASSARQQFGGTKSPLASRSAAFSPTKNELGTSPKPVIPVKPATESPSARAMPSPKTPPATKPKRIASIQAGSRAQGTDNGLGISTSVPESPISPADVKATSSPKSPPLPGKKPESIGRSFTPKQQSPTKPAPSESDTIIEKFFKEKPGSIKGELNINTQAVIANASQRSEKIKNLRKEIWQVTGDGKKITIPPQYEHILFEDNMYLCSHVYGSSDGKRVTDIYLWHGDGVSQSAVDDAQLFCRSAARDAGGKLTTIQQGKEPHKFFEALGGIVITRKGSADVGLVNMSSSSYMLCGRNHLGHIAFDEVELTPANLSSGFPFLITIGGTRTFLWKGVGSTPDELGCARLIGMDLGSSGEIQEVDEGAEPRSFWDLFSAEGKPASADVDWKTKASSDKYATRLFHVDADSRPLSGSSIMNWARRGSAPPGTAEVKIKEVSPYTQHDLGHDTISVLDTFFKVIVVVPRVATSKLTSFRAALFFAQEYSMLTASLEDRPFIPVGVVEFGGASNDLKQAFRKWDDSQSPLLASKSSLELTQALSSM